MSILQACFEWGLTPLAWKQAVITPFFKNGSASDAKHHRPISLTETPRKLLEAVVAAAIEDEASLAPPMHPYQNGFRAQRSTSDTIIALKETFLAVHYRPSARSSLPGRLIDASKHAYHKISTRLFCLDIRAAYDLLVRPIIGQKLYHAGPTLGSSHCSARSSINADIPSPFIGSQRFNNALE
jgi:hypothetical protein